MSRVGAVAIGRNEGERLRRCLETLRTQVDRVVYVDSGSTDGSVALARSLGVPILELSPDRPFTAARGRNEGFAALLREGELDHVQFVDGDCGVDPGWIGAASRVLDSDPSIGIVTGWRTEIHPDRNLFHAMSETEWHRPPGDIASCGGDMMVRVAAFRAAGGFDPRIICSEDEEFCLRLADRTGLRVHRVPRVMTHHDIDMTRLGQWWRRQVRAGHGYAEIGGMYPQHFRRERMRAWSYGLALPVLALPGALAGQWWVPALVALAYAASWLRTVQGLRRNGLGQAEALGQAGLMTLSKFPSLQGMLTYHLRRLRRAEFLIIEYKR